ncbi:uncharacterized protein AKAW2_11468A [Aspergillus luchuensis]|uniref:Uncharacterized protein n=1 Tax=Aspergillus kawachii TaxID=1069201 RepID=A0A7R7WQ29_ASPKA|nr:uncharacterized protein AKAW2_11468A [Aspergillus luchuensis]BCR94422.1 hypothetical protein AKAW2_11468A [Aspergillus luchuensis]BCS07023.1 hypothetical protein ALUC_11404A [Aspergillus luchuensis]
MQHSRSKEHNAVRPYPTTTQTEMETSNLFTHRIIAVYFSIFAYPHLLSRAPTSLAVFDLSPPSSFIRLKRAGSIKASVSPYRKHFVERGISLRNKGARSRLLRETLWLSCFFGIILLP